MDIGRAAAYAAREAIVRASLEPDGLLLWAFLGCSNWHGTTAAATPHHRTTSARSAEGHLDSPYRHFGARFGGRRRVSSGESSSVGCLILLDGPAFNGLAVSDVPDEHCSA